MDQHIILIAFLLTLFAGLSTGIGGLLALLAKHTNTNFLSLSLGLSAGVMLYVSFMEMMPIALSSLSDGYGEKQGTLYMIISFFGGMLLITLIDFLVPKSSNPHEIHSVEEMNQTTTINKRLQHTGFITTLSIAIHNFPEGIATFMSSLGSMDVAIPIAAAIAIHNIPEGIAVAVPIYHATNSRQKALWLSLLSGLAEPIGALVAYLFLMSFWTPITHGIIMAAVAGIMVFISLDELLPSAEKYGKHHLSIIGVVSGMAIMALSLYLFV